MAELLTIARPYADAAFAIARDENALAQWSDTLSHLAQVMNTSTAGELIHNPRLEPDQIATLIAEAAGSLSASQRNFVRVLAENERLSVLPEIADQFRQRRNAAEGSLDAAIESAYPLTEAQIDDIRTTLEEKYGRRVRATARVDSSLIGGVSIRIGDEVIDASVRGKLARLAASLRS
jgi:F-type H+-transporting ATPase subunit delta